MATLLFILWMFPTVMAAIWSFAAFDAGDALTGVMALLMAGFFATAGVGFLII